MRKLIIKILNLVYIAGAGVAIWGLCTKPIIKTTATIHASAQQIGDFLAPLVGGSTESRTPRAILREGETKEIREYLTAEKIAEAFEPYNGLNIENFSIEIPTSTAFRINNKNVIKELVEYNVGTLLDAALTAVVPPFQQLILNVTKNYAKDALKTAIDAQMAKFLGEGSEITIDQATQIYNNIEEVLSKNEPVELQELTSIIVGSDDDEEGATNALSILNSNPYRICNPQPDETEFLENPSKYYIKNDEGQYVNPESYSSDATYYFSKTYSQADIDRVDVESKMTDALSTVPGLVETDFEVKTPSELEFNGTIKSHTYYVYNGSKYINAEAYNSETVYYGKKYNVCEGKELDKARENPNRYFIIAEDGSYAKTSIFDSSKTYYKAADVDGYEALGTQPTESQFNSDKRSTTYYVKNGDIYTLAKSWSSETTYYVYKTVVNDIDTALTALINQYLLGKTDESSDSEGSSSTRLQTRADILTLSKSQEELKAALKEFAMGRIPYEQIMQIDAQYGTYVPFILLGIIVLFALPWGWFALVSLIRTFRRNKYWTRPRIVLLGAFLQLILGIVVTYGLKYALPLVASKVPQVKAISDMISIDIRFGCLIASFVYLGIFALSIVYWIISRRVKVEYKFDKQLARYEKRKSRGRY